MKRSDLAYASSLLDAATDLVKVRLGVLIPQVIAHEFSRSQPNIVDESAGAALHLHSSALQLIAESILSAAREHATLLVSKAVADKLGKVDAVKSWRKGHAERERRVQRDFDLWARGIRDRAARRARIERIHKGSIAASPTALRERSLSRQRTAMRERLAALNLSGLNS